MGYRLPKCRSESRSMREPSVVSLAARVDQVILPDIFPLNQIRTWAMLEMAYRVPTVSKAAGLRVAPAEVAPRRVVRKQARAGSPDGPSEHILRTYHPAPDRCLPGPVCEAG